MKRNCLLFSLIHYMIKVDGKELSMYYLVCMKMRLASFLKPSAFSWPFQNFPLLELL